MCICFKIYIIYVSILINNTLCIYINKVLFRNVVYAKSTNVTKSHRFVSAFYHRSRNYGNRASGQSISCNNSIKSASLAGKKVEPCSLCVLSPAVFCFSSFFRTSLFVHVEKFAAGISRFSINRDALVLWCLLKQTVAVTSSECHTCSRIYAPKNPKSTLFALEPCVQVGSRQCVLRISIKSSCVEHCSCKSLSSFCC